MKRFALVEMVKLCTSFPQRVKSQKTKLKSQKLGGCNGDFMLNARRINSTTTQNICVGVSKTPRTITWGYTAPEKTARDSHANS
jgi:hypothetical protein